MREVFADACYFIALVNPQDGLHAVAQRATQKLRGSRLVTTAPVLTEVLNYFSSWGPFLRIRTARYVEALTANPALLVVHPSWPRFEDALVRYRERADKGFSHVDCDAMLAMEQRAIEDALTDDRHFEQAGFTVLLKE